MMYFLVVALVVGAVTATVSFSPAANPSSWYYNYWCGDGHQYLDDAKCAKIFPAVEDRDWTCPIPALTKPPADYQRGGLYGDIKVDTSSLSSYINDDAINLCMVLTKRVADASQPQQVALYHKYFCLGERSASEPFETWSSSKIFAVANAAGHLRTNETSCAHGVYGVGGGFVNGKHGPDTQLGDLATVICSYDSTAGYSSNSLSSYFHDLGWRDRINSVVLNQWLQVPSDQTLGGNYGEATPSDLGFTVGVPGAAASCPADKDPWPVKYSNSITALTAVELTRRLVHHREMEESLRFPGVEWVDVRDLLYGAESSSLFPGQRWGGMTADTAIYLQSSSTMQSLLVENPTTLADGRWRIFSKLGAGYSSSRYVGEIVSNAHACVPTVADGGVVSGGLEVTITVRGSIPKDSSLSTVDLRVQAAMDAALTFAAKYN